mgnify:CR=1 FL=1
MPRISHRESEGLRQVDNSRKEGKEAFFFLLRLKKLVKSTCAENLAFGSDVVFVAPAWYLGSVNKSRRRRRRPFSVLAVKAAERLIVIAIWISGSSLCVSGTGWDEMG